MEPKPFAIITAFKRRHRMHEIKIKFHGCVVQLLYNSLFQLLYCADTEPIEFKETFLSNMLNNIEIRDVTVFGVILNTYG